MIGVYNNRAYKFCIITKLFLIIMVFSIVTIASFAGNNEKKYIKEAEVVTINHKND